MSEGFKVAMNWGNSRGAKGPSCFVIPLAMMGSRALIKTLGNLQDLRQRIYRKGKTEAVGGCGVDAGDLTGLKAPPIGCVS